MSEFINLSPGERYYYGSPESTYVTYVPAILEATERPAPLTITIPQMPEQGAMPTNYRNAGRKKLTDEVVKRNARLAEERKIKRAAEMASRAQQRAEKAQFKTNRLKNRHENFEQAKAELEVLMRMGNTKATEAQPGSEPLPAGAVIVKGLLEIPGKTCIRIDNKTIIYVKHGHNINAAVEKHRLAVKVNRII